MIKVDWKYLRQAMLIFGLSIIVATLMFFAADRFRNSQQEEYKISLAKLEATFRDYNGLVNDIDILEQYRALFLDYKLTGLVGDERRLSWIESLEATNSKLKLPRMTYSLRPREKFERPGLVKKSGVTVSSAPMSITMELLHEEDIFSVFNGLRNSIKNLFTVDNCTLSRSGELGKPLDTQKPNLMANCMIRWVTINVK